MVRKTTLCQQQNKLVTKCVDLAQHTWSKVLADDALEPLPK